MKTETIVMCVVLFLLGMLMANMLKDVCGCKNVEGQTATATKKISVPIHIVHLHDDHGHKPNYIPLFEGIKGWIEHSEKDKHEENALAEMVEHGKDYFNFDLVTGYITFTDSNTHHPTYNKIIHLLEYVNENHADTVKKEMGGDGKGIESGWGWAAAIGAVACVAVVGALCVGTAGIGCGAAVMGAGAMATAAGGGTVAAVAASSAVVVAPVVVGAASGVFVDAALEDDRGEGTETETGEYRSGPGGGGGGL
jgi:hypothetical protein